MDSLIYIILGMGAVTYLPRLAPFLMLKNRNIPGRVGAFLKCIPVAAIGALIIPSGFQATPDTPLAAVCGMLFTLVYGLWRGGIIVPVLGAVLVTYLVILAG